MKRWAIRITAFLLLGAIVNVAVAWGFGFWAPRTAGTATQALSAAELERLWASYVGDTHRYGFGGWKDARMATTSTEFGDCFDISQEGANIGISNALCTNVVIVESGWPRRALTHVNQRGLAVRDVRFATRKLDRDAFVWISESRTIWPGFVINTVFYAVILWLLFAAPFAMRRYRRNRHGLCPVCGYDLRGGATFVCPECGKAIAI